jgi:hypothetical protein
MTNSERTTRNADARDEHMRQGGVSGRARRHGRETRAGLPAHETSRPASVRAAHDAEPGSADGVAAGYLGPTPPVIPAPTWRRRLYIDRPSDLRLLAADLAHAHTVAIDAEFSQTHIRQPDEPSHRLALLQLASDNDYRASYVVDALRLADLSPLRALMEQPDTLKLFHGIGADARVLAARGLVACNTLDLEAVSRSIFGQRESGLQAMLRRACGIRLDKSLQRADWSRRPLTPAMVAYAARDAEMTLVLYHWLSANYPWAMALHTMPADEPLPPVAPWILPYLEGARPKPAALALAEAGIADDIARQQGELRAALAAVRHPNHRARVIRLIVDLELEGLAPDLHVYLSSPASEERAGAARALGRLHDREATPLIQPLLEDPVQDVRQAAQLAVESLAATSHRRPSRPPRPSGGPVRWSSDEGTAADPAEEGGWRAALRASLVTPSDSPAQAKNDE